MEYRLNQKIDSTKIEIKDLIIQNQLINFEVKELDHTIWLLQNRINCLRKTQQANTKITNEKQEILREIVKLKEEQYNNDTIT